MIVESAVLENYGPFLSCRASLKAGGCAGVPELSQKAPSGAACGGSPWLIAGGSRLEQSCFLDGLARLLSCFVQAMRRSRRAGVLAGLPSPLPSPLPVPSAGGLQPVPDDQADPAGVVPALSSLACTVRDGRSIFGWRLAKAGEGSRTRRASALGDARFLAGLYLQRRVRDASCSLPLVACYPRDRRLFAGTGKRSRDAAGPKASGACHAYHAYDACGAGLGAPAALCRFLALLSDGHSGEGSGNAPDGGPAPSPLPIPKATSPERLKACILGALQSLFPDCTDLELQAGLSPRLLLVREGRLRDLAFLPRGDALLGALAADLACRLALLNPALANPLEGGGIVLVDGLDLDLPALDAQPPADPALNDLVWPRPSLSLASAVRGLRAAFPGCQFVFTQGSASGRPAAAELGLALAEACGVLPCVLALERRQPASGAA
ncbi:MAG: hypothetical protein K6C33_10555 [Desulfovibrio sp.]|nr:hypothetical protein [Desulfovibrio sp.]